MKTFRLVYMLIGVLLTSGVLLASMRGLPGKDMELYETACSLEDGRSDMIWPGLYISHYPVALRKGTAEYVIFNGSVKERKPVLPVIACTAYPAEGEINVFVPSKSVMDSLGQIAEGFSTGLEESIINQFSINSKKMSDSQYVAILYHETMHALQLSCCKERITAMAVDNDIDMEETMAEIENDPDVLSIYKKQTELLHRLVTSDDDKPDIESVAEYIKIREDTLALLCSKTGIDEDRISRYTDLYEFLEGTARYVEAKTALVLSDDILYQQYLSSLQDTVPGREKYYRSGMGICMLLDRLNPGWKHDLLSGGSTLIDILENAVGVSVDGGERVYGPVG